MSFVKMTGEEFIAEIQKRFGTTVVTKDQLMTLRDDKISVPFKAWESPTGDKYDVTDGIRNYVAKPKAPSKLPSKSVKAKSKPKSNPVPAPTVVSEAGVRAVTGSVGNNVPSYSPGFVKWGTYDDIKTIIDSRRFFPLFITGLSGNGKTLNVKQACAETGRGYHRVNITIETSEDDLIGGFRLIDGDSVFEYGPVLKAMIAGDVLLLDEVDLGGPKLMTLQSVLEGSGYYIKKLGQWVYPAEGFTVIATANTKGKGSTDGQFQFTNVMNEAFLERFKITIEQPYPEVKDEQRILSAMLKTFTGARSLDIDTKRTVEMLAEWAGVIRDSYSAGAIDSVISTRRNVIIAETFTIYGDIEKAIHLAIARFDEETQDAMKSSYRTVDGRVAEKYARLEAEAIKRAAAKINRKEQKKAETSGIDELEPVQSELDKMRAAAAVTI